MAPVCRAAGRNCCLSRLCVPASALGYQPAAAGDLPCGGPRSMHVHAAHQSAALLARPQVAWDPHNEESDPASQFPYGT